MKISDELRGWADVHCGEECEEYLGLLADRIDREMVELPRDKDGKVIHVGDTVFPEDGRASKVTCIEFSHGLHDIALSVCGNFLPVFPEHVTHEYPDSWERIADDIERAEKWCDEEGEYGTGITSVKESTLHEWADRIRKLATNGILAALLDDGSKTGTPYDETITLAIQNASVYYGLADELAEKDGE